MTWIDALRLFAGLSMVGLHATADPQGHPFAQYEVGERIAPMLLRMVLYTARTELFLMISVFLLLMSLERRPRAYRYVMGEQARRLLLPFLFWTGFYAFYGLIKANAFGYLSAEIARLSNPIDMIGFITLGSVKYHMHFIPTLFGMLLFYPLFRVAYRYPAFGLSVVVCVLIKRELDLFIFAEFWGSDALPFLVRTVKVLTYAGYGLAAAALLGLWHRCRTEDLRQWAAPVGFLCLLLILIKLIATWKTIETGEWPFDYTPGYWADFLLPVALLLIAVCLSASRLPPVISVLSRFSFGIYLCHPIFLDMAEIWLRGTDLTPIVQVFIKIGWTLPCVSAFVWVLSRVPGVAWTIGLGPLPFRVGGHQRVGLDNLKKVSAGK